jgi:predicted RNA-binding Zn-ribbon protein involved in translation (DUF1610 family)
VPTDPRSGAAVGRLYEALADALARRGGPPAADVTVSEIYQTLVPYARARAELGFEMNADYEHALMRLIAGEGGYATLEQPEARAQVARELESQNPDVTLYRRFAASTVRLSPSPTPRDGEGVSEGASPMPDAGGGPASRYVSLTNSPAWIRPPPAQAADAPDPTLGAVAGDAPGGAAATPATDATDAPRGAAADDRAEPASTRPDSTRPDSTEAVWGEALERAADGGAGGGELAERSERALDRGLAHLSTILGDDDAERTVPGSGRGAPGAASALPGEPPTDVGEGEGAGEEGIRARDEGDAREIPVSASRPIECGSCGRSLPTDREARFCPYCGSEQPTVCAACGDDMAPDWSYCPACGAEA